MAGIYGMAATGEGGRRLHARGVVQCNVTCRGCAVPDRGIVSDILKGYLDTLYKMAPSKPAHG